MEGNGGIVMHKFTYFFGRLIIYMYFCSLLNFIILTGFAVMRFVILNLKWYIEGLAAMLIPHFYCLLPFLTARISSLISSNESSWPLSDSAKRLCCMKMGHLHNHVECSVKTPKTEILLFLFCFTKINSYICSRKWL